MENIITIIAKYSLVILKKLIYLVILYLTYNPVKEFLVNSLKKVLKKNKTDELIISFLIPTLTSFLIIFYFFNAIEILGLELSSFVTLLASIGIGVGLALKANFSDIAGGIQILLTKPFKKGDFITACGSEGVVQRITFLCTLLYTADNRKVIIPNGKLSTSVVTTVTANPERRADFVFFAEKNSSIDKVKDVLLDVVNSHPSVLKDRGIFVRFSKETESALEFIVRVWTLKENFRDLSADIQEEVKKSFDREGINFPYQSYDMEIK
ncbi:MAG: mechanosensitive ion channel [Cetobacterium sp.]